MAHFSKWNKEDEELREVESSAGDISAESTVTNGLPDKIHMGIEGRDNSISDSFNDSNWRKSKRGNTSNTSFRARFSHLQSGGFGSSGFGGSNHFRHRKSRAPPQGNFDWSVAKVAANHLKFCSGEHCKSWLPLHAFGSNYNMCDGLDIYCITCNTNYRNGKRVERIVKPALDTKPVIKDKYCAFKEQYESDVFAETQTREVEKRIRQAGIEAKGRFKRDVQIDSSNVCRKLFSDGLYKCEVTNEPMTPACFLDHHSITFELRENGEGKKFVDVICSDCKKI